MAQCVVTDHAEAEFALVVADQWQRHGIGTALCGVLFQHARARRLARLGGFVLTENRAMLRFAAKLGFSLVRDADATLTRAVIALDPDLPAPDVGADGEPPISVIPAQAGMRRRPPRSLTVPSKPVAAHAARLRGNARKRNDERHLQCDRTQGPRATPRASPLREAIAGDFNDAHGVRRGNLASDQSSRNSPQHSDEAGWSGTSTPVRISSSFENGSG